MKKSILLMVLGIYLLALPSRAQVIFSENFNSGNIPATFTLYNVDGRTVDPSVDTLMNFGMNAWIANSAITNLVPPDTAAYACSFYSPVGAADDWLVTPAIAIPPTGNTILTWRGRSWDVDFLETYEVRVATANSLAALGAAGALLQTNTDPTTWTAHTQSLAAFAGQTVYIAFRNISNDKFIVSIDDIRVMGATSDLQLASALNPSEYTSIPFSQIIPLNTGCTLTNAGSTTLLNTTANLTITNLTTATVVNTQTLVGSTSLAPGASSIVTGSAFTPTAEGVYEFRYVASFAGTDANRANDTFIKIISISPNLYARDQIILFGSSVITGAAGVPGRAFELAQRYTIVNATNIQVDTVFSFFGEKRVGARYRAKLYAAGAAGPTGPAVYISSTYTTTAADTVGGFNGLIGLPFNPPVTVPAVGTYYVSVEQMDTFNAGIAYADNIVTPATTYFTINSGTSWTDLASTTLNKAFLIWPHLRSSAACNLVASGNGTNPTCGNPNGTASVTVTGGTGTSTYAWSTGATTASLTNLGAGTYIVTVTNAGCTDTARVTLTNSNTLMVTATSTGTTCGLSNGAALVTGMPSGATFSWSNGQSTSSINNLAAGNYSVTVTSGTCIGTASVTVNASVVHTVSVTTTTASCGASNGSATATVSPMGTYSFAWSSGATTATAANLAAGNYSVTVTGGGCSVTAVAAVSNANAPTASASVITQLSCFGGNNAVAQATGSGGTGTITYTWSNGATTATASNLSAGNYTVSVRDAANCLAVVNVTVNSPAQLIASASSTGVNCNGASNGSATVNASGGTGQLTYTWSNGASTTSLSNLTAGTYTVTVRDANQCSVTASTVVSQPAAINASASATSVNCFGASTGTATVVATGGTGNLTYTWNTAPNQTNATATGLAAGSYTVTVRDANNCSTTASAVVTGPAAALTASAVATGTSATATANGGTPNYNYAWSNGQTSATATNLPNGANTVTVTDSKGCTASATVNIVNGIEESAIGMNEFAVYPNPSNGNFLVVAKLQTSSDVQLQVTDLTGRTVFEATEKNVREINRPIALEIAAGTYIVRVITSSGEVRKHITIQK